MNRFFQLSAVMMSLLLLHPFAFAKSVIDGPPRDRKQPLVQLAILLDTSNSMDGLIEQAKSQLWKIANDLVYAKRNGKTPMLEVALYEYGNNNLPAGENYIRQVVPFTSDLDRVSQQLFALRTNGGSEYCGAVIKDAVSSLDWDKEDDTYKVMFVAGNEPFTQGPVPYQAAMEDAKRKGIYVNTIYCGAYAEGAQTGWDSGARLAKGRYFNIDADQKVVVSPTPFDGEIDRLGARMNSTYVPYAAAGSQGYSLMAQADQAALGLSAAGASSERMLYKAAAPAAAKPSWDAATQVASGKVRANELRREDLPMELRKKNDAELETYLKEQQATRETIQKDIQALKVKRDAYLAEEAKKNAGQPLTLDQALREGMRKQAVEKGFRFAHP